MKTFLQTLHLPELFQMARKSIKKEPVPQEGISDLPSRATYETPQQWPIPGSGDTIVDTDVVMHEDLDHVPNGASQASQHNATARHSSEETVAPEACGGLEILGRGVKELVQAVQNLRHIGIEDLVLPLPKIVVVGDQSTGKSSLIEGIRSVNHIGSCHLIYSTANYNLLAASKFRVSSASAPG